MALANDDDVVKTSLVRELGATAYACYPLKASDGRLLGTFTVASATRDRFTDG